VFPKQTDSLTEATLPKFEHTFETMCKEDTIQFSVYFQGKKITHFIL